MVPIGVVLAMAGVIPALMALTGRMTLGRRCLLLALSGALMVLGVLVAASRI